MKAVWLRAICAGIAMALVIPGAAWAGAASASPMAALARLERGQWELREHGEDDGVRKLCVKDLRQLLQIRHPGNSCKMFIVSDSANQLVVTYECALAGGGRTDLRVETSRLIQINSQGIADGAPFSLSLEGRRTGVCD